MRDFEERCVNSAVVHSIMEQVKKKVPNNEIRVRVSDMHKQFNGAITEKQIRKKVRRKICLPVGASAVGRGRPGAANQQPGMNDGDDFIGDEFELNPGWDRRCQLDPSSKAPPPGFWTKL